MGNQAKDPQTLKNTSVSLMTMMPMMMAVIPVITVNVNAGHILSLCILIILTGRHYIQYLIIFHYNCKFSFQIVIYCVVFTFQEAG